VLSLLQAAPDLTPSLTHVRSLYTYVLLSSIYFPADLITDIRFASAVTTPRKVRFEKSRPILQLRAKRSLLYFTF
jgi:hypothetical protein